MNLKGMNLTEISGKREVYLPVKSLDTESEWRTVYVKKSQAAQVIMELLRKNSKKVSR